MIIIIIIIIIIIFLLLRVFHTSVSWWLFTGFEWQQAFASLQDFSQYSGQSQQCWSLHGLHLSSSFQVLQSLYLIWWLYWTDQLQLVAPSWFGWVLWHYNHCRLFNTKWYLYIHIKYIYDLKTYFLDNILKQACAFFCTQLNGFKYCCIIVSI